MKPFTFSFQSSSGRARRELHGGGGEGEGDREILEPLQCETLLHVQKFLQDSALFFKTSGVVLYFILFLH